MPYLARLAHSSDMVAMSEFDPPARVVRPTSAIFLRLSLAGTPQGIIDISYREIANHTVPAAGSIEAEIDGVLAGTIQLNWRQPQPNPPAPSRLSLRNDVPAYFVFLLDPGNYRFSTDSYPFRIEAGKADYHYEARCVWRDNAIFRHGRTPPVGANAIAGYFIAYSDADLNHSGTGSFRSNFNIYLDLDYPGSAPVPITVDPDVGHPGGAD